MRPRLVEVQTLGAIQVALDAALRGLNKLLAMDDDIGNLLVRGNHTIKLLEVLVHNLLQIVEVDTLGRSKFVVGHYKSRKAAIILDNERLANKV